MKATNTPMEPHGPEMASSSEAQSDAWNSFDVSNCKKKHKLYQSCCFCDEAKSNLKMANNINIPGALFLPDKGRNGIEVIITVARRFFFCLLLLLYSVSGNLFV